MRVNLNQMGVFYLAARHKSMAAAARELYVSPPAVTMQIKKMEAWLGFSVFERCSGELRLTPRGRALYEVIEPMFGALGQVEHDINDLVQKEGGEARIGAHHMPANYFMPDLLARVRARYPGLNVRLELGTQDKLLEKLFQRRLDMIVVANGLPPESGCGLAHLFDEECPLVAAAGNALGRLESIPAGRLSSIPLIVQQEGTGVLRGVMEFLGRNNVRPNIMLNNLSSDVIKGFLAKMEAAAFIGRFIVRKDLEEGNLREIKIDEGPLMCSFYLAYVHSRHLPLKIERFLEAASGFAPPRSSG